MSSYFDVNEHTNFPWVREKLTTQNKPTVVTGYWQNGILLFDDKLCVCPSVCARARVCLPAHVCSQNSLKEDEEKDDIIHIGNSIMTFYAALIDLLGRCAPEKHVSSHPHPHPHPHPYIHSKPEFSPEPFYLSWSMQVKVKPSGSKPFWGLLYLLKTWLESSAFHSSFQAWKKVAFFSRLQPVRHPPINNVGQSGALTLSAGVFFSLCAQTDWYWSRICQLGFVLTTKPLWSFSWRESMGSRTRIFCCTC